MEYKVDCEGCTLEGAGLDFTEYKAKQYYISSNSI